VTVFAYLLLFGGAPQPACARFGAAEKVVDLAAGDLPESSGLALSATHDNLLWTHNDSGDAASLYAFTLSGEGRGRIDLSGASADDWEGLAIGPCGAATCLVVGDIGSTRSQPAEMVLWRIEEPVPPGDGERLEVAAQRLTLTFGDAPYDAEGLAIDPRNGDILLTEKSLDTRFRIYRVPAAAWDRPEARVSPELLWVAELGGGLESSFVTQADIDPSGSELFVGTYGAGFRLPIARDDDGVILGFGEPGPGPIYADGQCEAGAYAPDGLAIWFTCEAERTPLARADCAALSIPAAPTPDPTPQPTDPDGCGCAAQAQGSWLLAALIVGRRRRRWQNPS
jgi:hypothetical protein